MSEPNDKQIEQPKVGKLPPSDLQKQMEHDAGLIGIITEDKKRLRYESDVWRSKYMFMERCHSAGIDQNGEHIKRIQRLERDKDEIRDDYKRQLLAEQQVSAGLREDLEQLRSLAKTREVCGHSTSWQCAGEGGFYCLMCRAEAAEASLAEARAKFEEEKSIVDRVWKALGISTYEEAGGKAIDEIVATLKAQEAPEKAWERGYLAGAEHVAGDLGANLLGLHIPPYTPPSTKEGQ